MNKAIPAAIVLCLVIFGAAFVTGLGQQSIDRHNAVNKYGTKQLVHVDEYNNKTRVIVVDDCEYIQYDETMIHKTNCKNPECPEAK